MKLNTMRMISLVSLSRSLSFESHVSYVGRLCVCILYNICARFTVLGGVAKALVVLAARFNSIILHAILFCASFHLYFFSSYISFRFVPFHSVHFVRSFNANFRLRKLFRQKCNNRTEAKYFNCVSRNNGTCTTNKMTSTAHKMCVFVCVCLAKKDGKNLLFRIHILQSS